MVEDLVWLRAVRAERADGTEPEALMSARMSRTGYVGGEVSGSGSAGMTARGDHEPTANRRAAKGSRAGRWSLAVELRSYEEPGRAAQHRFAADVALAALAPRS